MYLLASLSGSLSAVVYKYGLHRDLEIWIMKEYNVKESWIKEFKIGGNGEILIEYKVGKLALYDVANGIYKGITFKGMPKFSGADDDIKGIVKKVNIPFSAAMPEFMQICNALQQLCFAELSATSDDVKGIVKKIDIPFSTYMAVAEFTVEDKMEAWQMLL
ncbi:hypothetical protein AgCh_003735 [Apium graveolens]